MEASLTCAVCLSLFEEPVTLPLCSHNFCRGCVLECLASAEAARLQQQQQPRGQGQARLSRGGPGPSGGGEAPGARVSCPLCRKLCPLPRGGAAALPVNTTLAEVVKLYRSGAAKAEEAEQGQGPGLLSPLALGGACQKHPSRLVQLYCRMCRQAGCGLCVSEEHQGIFHSVNLIDTVYQEEKLNFFSSLKKMRLINEKLVNEIASQPKDVDMLLGNNAATIELEFGEIFKTLEMKKHQLLEEVENQRSKKEKEFQIWKKMKETHKKTIESFLKDCEKLVHECDPQRFLEVACGLNTRMKTQLDLMNIASNYEKAPDCTQKKMDIKPVVNEILALKLVPVNVGSVKGMGNRGILVSFLPPAGKEDSAKDPLFNSTTDQGQEQKNIPSTFLPVAGQEEMLADGSRICTRLMSVSGMAAFQNMSHEELRYKHYMGRQKPPDESKTQTSRANKKYKFVAAEALNDRSSEKPLVCFTKANDTAKGEVGTLQKSNGSERGFSRTSHHGVPSTNTNSSETNGDLKSVHERSSQEVTTPASSENSKDSAIKEESPVQASSVISSETDKNSNTSTDLKPAASAAVTVSNPDLGVSGERLSASPFAFGSCDNSFPGPVKDTRVFSFKKKDRKCVFPQFYLGKCDRADKTDNQDESKLGNHSPATKATVSDASTSPNLDSADSEKPGFSFHSGSSEGGCWGGLGVTNTFGVLPLHTFVGRSEKASYKNTAVRIRGKALSAKGTAGWDTQKPSALWEQKAHTSKPSTSLAWGTSETTSAAGGKGFFPPLPSPGSSLFTFGSNPLQFSSFGVAVGNTSDLPTSSMFLFGNGTDTAEEEPVRCHEAPLNLGKAVSLGSTEPASRSNHPPCEGSLCPANSAKAPQSAELVPDGNFHSKSLISVIRAARHESAPPPQPVAAAKEPEAKGKDEASRTVTENSRSWLGQGDEPASILLQSTACPVPGVSMDPPAGGSVLSVCEAGGRASDSDSDTKELSQTSVSTDSSSTSEYFSVAKDKIATRRKSEA
ncbi:uncharacterized protein LJ264_004295 [Porphyrio hochstetteri]